MLFFSKLSSETFSFSHSSYTVFNVFIRVAVQMEQCSSKTFYIFLFFSNLFSKRLSLLPYSLRCFLFPHHFLHILFLPILVLYQSYSLRKIKVQKILKKPQFLLICRHIYFLLFARPYRCDMFNCSGRLIHYYWKILKLQKWLLGSCSILVYFKQRIFFLYY